MKKKRYRVKEVVRECNGDRKKRFYPQRTVLGIWMCYECYPCGAVEYEDLESANKFLNMKMLQNGDKTVKFHDHN